MSDLSPKADLLPSLGRLVRGLSALFWGLPLTLVVGVQTAKTEWLSSLGVTPMLVCTGLLLFGLMQLGRFHQQERIWMETLDRAKLLGLINTGLSPFVFWWHKMPQSTFYTLAVSLLALSSLVFLFDLNQVLQRLTGMLPDEMLRHETKVFTTLNLYLLMSTVVMLAVIVTLSQLRPQPFILRFLGFPETLWFVVFLILPSLAMTMALIWKIKETILASIFGAEG